ncbi:hypothetical protein [Limosilactobacillus balticus]|uniref:Uncharacterized protein n=1 Tax=Limosilactobacillus balticus TaxID=2759747 RepID=A0ABS8RF87_9LACO|nr:hypothetical protein [Limosilactobacillus balticus]MBB1128358.1 hypothetical protein [Limosilactobacillus balticus]MCD7139697.1 hypothetical protein [Limosilactobacillus balticus]
MKFTGIDGITIIAILSLIGNGLQMYYSGKKEKSAAELNKIKEQNNFNLQKQIAENNLKNNQEERNLKKYELQTKLSEQHFDFVSDRMQDLFEEYLKVTHSEIDVAYQIWHNKGIEFSKKQRELELLVLMYCPECEEYINKIHSYRPEKDIIYTIYDHPENEMALLESKEYYRKYIDKIAITFNQKLLKEK